MATSQGGDRSTPGRKRGASPGVHRLHSTAADRSKYTRAGEQQRRPRLAPGTPLTVAALNGGLAYAAIPDTDGTIRGCYVSKTGTLSVRDSSAPCPRGSTSLDWAKGAQPARQGPRDQRDHPGPLGPPVPRDPGA